MSNTPDFSSMSKEDIIKFYEERLSVKEQDMKDNAKKILRLNSKISELKSDVASLEKKVDNYKIHENNYDTMIDNINHFIQDCKVSIDLFREENLPSPAHRELHEDFFKRLIFSHVEQLRAYKIMQEHALNLPTSERNRGLPQEQKPKIKDKTKPTMDNTIPGTGTTTDNPPVSSSEPSNISEADAEAIAIGKEDNIEATVKVISSENTDGNEDPALDEEPLLCEEFEKPVNIPSQDLKDTNQDEITSALKALLTSKNMELSTPLEFLQKGTEVLKDLGTCQYRNEGAVKRREKKILSIVDSNEVSGILCIDGDTARHYCPECRAVKEFRIEGKRERINSVISKNSLNGQVKTVLAPVYTAVCPECGHVIELNPAVYPELTYIMDENSIFKSGFKMTASQRLTEQPLDTDVETAISNKKANISQSDNDLVSTFKDSGQRPDSHTENPAAMTGSDTQNPQEQRDRNSTEHEEKSKNSSATDTLNTERTVTESEKTAIIKDLSATSDTLRTGTENHDSNQNLSQNLQLNSNLTQTEKNREYKKAIKEQQKEREKIYKDLVLNSQGLTVKCGTYDLIPTAYEGLQVINPWTFNENAYAMTPAFLKSSMSVGLLTTCGAIFSQMGVSKNKIHTVFEGDGMQISRDQLTGGINCFARAFLHKASQQILSDITRYSEGCVADESTILVNETAAIKQAEHRGRKSQIWCVTSCWTSPVKATYYRVTDTRGAQTVVDLFKDRDKDSNLKALLADGYTGYDSGLKTLKDEFGIDLERASCWCHIRRPIHRLLKAGGLLRIYNKYLLPAGSSFTDFARNLENYMQEPKEGFVITPTYYVLMVIYYLANALFALDSSVVIRHHFDCQSEEFKKDLLKIRTECSAKIVDLIFDLIIHYIINNRNLIEVKYRNGMLKYKANHYSTEDKTLLSFLSYEERLRSFLKRPAIELSQSAAERGLKAAIAVRVNCQKLQSEDGANAFADYLTIAETCNLNGVPVNSYLLWLTANLKLRLYNSKQEGHYDPTYFAMPKREKIIDDNGETIRIGIYDKRNKMCYDKIDVRGLMPYDYKKYL